MSATRRSVPLYVLLAVIAFCALQLQHQLAGPSVLTKYAALLRMTDLRHVSPSPELMINARSIAFLASLAWMSRLGTLATTPEVMA